MFSEAIMWSEYLTFARRKKTYVYRGIFLVVLLFVTLTRWPKGSDFAWSELSEIGEGIVNLALAIQFICSCIFTAPHVANAIVQEKEQGTLGLLLISRLSTVEIVYGKMLARMMHVLSVLFYSLPFLILAVNIGGVSYGHLLAGFSIVLATTFLAGAIGVFMGTFCGGLLSASLWSYAVLGLAVFLPFAHIFGLDTYTNFLMISPGETMWQLLTAGVSETVVLWRYYFVPVGYSLVLSLVLSAVSVPVIRRAARKTSGEGEPATRQGRAPGIVRRWVRWIAGDSENNNDPVLWREVQTLASGSASFYVALVVLTLLSCALSLVYQYLVLTNRAPRLEANLIRLRDFVPFVLFICYALLGTTLLTATLVGALGFMREKQSRSIETLVLTPLNCEEIIGGKARGINKFIIPFVFWPVLLCLSLVPAGLMRDEAPAVLLNTLAIALMGLGVTPYIVYGALDVSLIENRGFKSITRSVTKMLVFLVLGVVIALQVIALPLMLSDAGSSDLMRFSIIAFGISLLLGGYAFIRRRALLNTMVDHFEYYLGIAETTMQGFRPPRNMGELIGGPGSSE